MDGLMVKRKDRGAGGGRIRRIVGLVAMLLVVVCLSSAAFLAGGFVRFAEGVATMRPPETVGETDGIVVLTGGAHRIEQAVQLLREGKGERLLISGVNPDTGRRSLTRLTGGDAELFECCVDLDYAAQNTIGNAQMTARWAEEHGIKRIILVTSDYHLPRSMIEMGIVCADLEIVPYPVHPDEIWRADGTPSRLGLRLLAMEYVKMLAARTRIAFGLVPTRDIDEHVVAHAANS